MLRFEIVGERTHTHKQTTTSKHLSEAPFSSSNGFQRKNHHLIMHTKPSRRIGRAGSVFVERRRRVECINM